MRRSATRPLSTSSFRPTWSIRASSSQEGIGVRDSLFVYAVGRIVVWVPASSPLDPATALRAASVRHVAIANPRHAPYGRAAEAALRSLGVYDGVAGKLVLGENIAQTLEFVQSGAADVGIVALSLALAPPVRGQGRYWEVPWYGLPEDRAGRPHLERLEGRPGVPVVSSGRPARGAS